MNDLSSISTTVYVNNIAIHQPVTTLTGLVITGVCLLFYYRLNNISSTNICTHYWKLFFLNMSTSTALGACSHAFFEIHAGIGYNSFWLTTQVFNAIAIYMAQQATLYSALNKTSNTTKKRWDIYSKGLLIVVIVAVFLFHNFLVTVANATLGLMPIMVIHFIDSSREPSSRWIAYGILLSFLTAFVHLFKIGISPYFNHLDIAHLLIVVNLSWVYRGVKQRGESYLLKRDFNS